MSETMPFVSLIMPAKNEGINVLTTIDSALQAKTKYPFEIIIVDDGSTDQCCDFVHSHESSNRMQLIRTEGIGLARAKNLGAERSKGDFLIFCDAHLQFEDLWIDRLLEPIRNQMCDGITPGIAPIDNPSQVGYGQTLNYTLSVQWNGLQQQTPFPTAVLPGGCFAVSRTVFFDIGGFDKGFKVWGYEDVEISLKMWLFGYRCYAQPAVKILHLFRTSFPYTVSYDDVYYNMLRMAYSHFNETRIHKCRQIIRQLNSNLDHLVRSNGVLEQRHHYFNRRKHDDNWYMSTFRVPF
ncbi:glycosyltransferase family 2 protein [Alicyclobacillus pomorum]|uniref:glycosyltransferase family 2 protein n=1 Tax=Alicyclobacillus pomorum TaxID=204470 RepID=UPI00041AF158|nr:glycosyltransferase [Alicyclobacillus pomorum]